jgi:hypothetical protein
MMVTSAPAETIHSAILARPTMTRLVQPPIRDVSEVDSPEKHLHIKAQTLRLYNPGSHQWSIYLLDLDKGEISSSPVVGQFTWQRSGRTECCLDGAAADR